MSEMNDNSKLSDEDLVAYLDGVLENDRREFIERALLHDEVLRKRFEELRAGNRPFAEAFEFLLSVAPQEKLRAMFDQVFILPSSMDFRKRAYFSGLASLAAAVVLIISGIVLGLLLADRFSASPASRDQDVMSEKNWREAVAEYQALYRRVTLERIHQLPDEQDRSIAFASNQLGLKLTRQELALEGYDFKRAQVLAWKDHPLIQLTYLPPKSNPVAFCITPISSTDKPPKNERREGQNIVHWVKGGFGFMIIGEQLFGELERLASILKAQIS